MTLRVDRLTIRLPATMADQGEKIGRLLAEALPHLRLERSVRVGHLSVAPVTVKRGARPEEVAEAAANQIALSFGGRRE